MEHQLDNMENKELISKSKR